MSIFTQVKMRKPKYSKFNLSHEKKLSTQFGKITPILNMPVMPGDRFRGSSELFVRFAPQITPTMERYYATVHYFFVPYRIIWDEWEKFINGGGERGTIDPLPVMPYKEINSTTFGQFGTGSLADYLGIPPVGNITDPNAVQIEVFPFRAYFMIFNEYYRDQNLQDPLAYPTTSGEDPTAYSIQLKSYPKDYFRGALPWAQRGQEVTLPFDDIQYKGTSDVVLATGGPATDGPLTSSGGLLLAGTTPGASRIENIENIGAPTINELRTAYRLQEWLEKNARAGARYVEQLLAHFNVISDDARLQRPEYLGGGITNISVDPVLNTTGLAEVSADDGGVQGRMAGYSVGLGKTNQFSKRFKEHGLILGLATIMHRNVYHQGIPKFWSRFDFLDHPFPTFANLGEQEIKNKELYVDYSDTSTQDETWGYVPRYAEYKDGAIYSGIHGDFRFNLNFWHYAQIYDSLPPLNADFMKYNNDDRIFNVIDQSVDNVYLHIFNQVSAVRPLPYFGTPRT